MLLSDWDIDHAITIGHIAIDPYDADLVQPSSIDVRLDRWYRRPKFDVRHLDVADVQEGHTELYDAQPGGKIHLGPGEFILGSTAERVTLGGFHAARFEGKSSIARLGVAVHVTGGFIDPGFEGQVTVEIANLAPWAITLRAGMRIGQLAFHRLSSHPRRLYAVKGNYAGQQGPTESRFALDILPADYPSPAVA